jgi:hypothetical protein
MGKSKHTFAHFIVFIPKFNYAQNQKIPINNYCAAGYVFVILQANFNFYYKCKKLLYLLSVFFVS